VCPSSIYADDLSSAHWPFLYCGYHLPVLCLVSLSCLSYILFPTCPLQQPSNNLSRRSACSWILCWTLYQKGPRMIKYGLLWILMRVKHHMRLSTASLMPCLGRIVMIPVAIFTMSVTAAYEKCDALDSHGINVPRKITESVVSSLEAWRIQWSIPAMVNSLRPSNWAIS